MDGIYIPCEKTRMGRLGSHVLENHRAPRLVFLLDA